MEMYLLSTYYVSGWGNSSGTDVFSLSTYVVVGRDGVINNQEVNRQSRG